MSDLGPIWRWLLLVSVSICAASGLVYELALVSLSTSLNGGGIVETSLIVAGYVAALGLGALLVKPFLNWPAQTFLGVETLLGLIGGCSALVLYFTFATIGQSLWILVIATAAIGILVGAELPLLMTMIQQGRLADAKTTGSLVATLNAADYLGALLGGLAWPFVLLPWLGMMRGAGPAAELGLGGFAESQLFEYHLYTLGRPTTIANKEIKQVSLLNAADVPATKKLIYEGQGFHWRSYGPNYRPGDGVDTDPNQKVHVVVEIVNSEKNRLGMPLPKGRVRVYKQDVEGQLQFVGEDTIDHTPRDEKIKLYIGDAFDVVCTRTRTDFRRISTDVIEQSFEINARNRKKDEAVTLTIAEHPWGDWEVLEKSHDFTKVDARTIHFVVEIPAGQELKVSYRVRSKF